MTGHDLAAAARSLVGSRFRLHGRDPATGLDCIGLLYAAMARAGRPIVLPTGYPLRLAQPDRWMPDPGACGFAPTQFPMLPGDVVLGRPSPGQVHLAISVDASNWAHAHAALRRVVISPGLPAGPVIHHWRLLPPS